MRRTKYSKEYGGCLGKYWGSTYIQYVEMFSTVLDSTLAVLTNQSTTRISISQRKHVLGTYASVVFLFFFFFH